MRPHRRRFAPDNAPLECRALLSGCGEVVTLPDDVFAAIEVEAAPGHDAGVGAALSPPGLQPTPDGSAEEEDLLPTESAIVPTVEPPSRIPPGD